MATTIRKAAGRALKRARKGAAGALTTKSGRKKTMKKVKQTASRATALAKRLSDAVTRRRRKARRAKLAAAAGAGVLAAAAGLAVARGRKGRKHK